MHLIQVALKVGKHILKISSSFAIFSMLAVCTHEYMCVDINKCTDTVQHILSFTVSASTTSAPKTSKPSPTIFGLNVTRTDLQYVGDLADPNSETFSNISFQFCDMVSELNKSTLTKQYKICCT